MAELKYFTPILKWLSVVADESTDLDADPQTKGIFAGCTVTPTIAGSDARAVRAEDLTPSAALLALAPFEARLDDGRLMLRADSDKPATAYANLAAFPLTGDTGRLYRALDTDLFYEWNGSEYVLSVDYARLKLLANCPVLELPDGITIWYEFRFHHVTYNGSKQDLPTITIAAPTIAEDHDDLTDGEIVVNLATSEWVDNLTPVGGEIFVRNVPDDVGLVGDDVQFYRQGLPLGDPLDLLITGVPADMDDITDATAPGKAVVRAATASAQRDALQIPSYFRRVRNIADSNGTDDTAAVQAVLAEGAGEVVFRKGTTSLIAGAASMLAPQSNTRIIIEEGATIQVIPNALGLYYLFNLNGVNNVTIEGAGTLLGDSPTHTGSTGHHGHLINITNGATDCRVLGPLHLKQAWGDGIFIGTTALCYDVLVDGAIIEDTRRCGINVFWVDGCEIRNTRIFDISLTGFDPAGCPGYGIGIEPNAAQLVNNVTIDNAAIQDCAGNAVAALGHFATVSGVTIRAVKALDCANNSGATLGSPHGIRVKNVDDPQIVDNTVIGTGWVGATAAAGLTVDICNRARVRGGHYADARGPGVYINASPGASVSGASVYNSLRRGFLISGSDDVTIRSNDLVDNCQDGFAGSAHVQIIGSDRVATQGNTFRGGLADAWVGVDAASVDCVVEGNVGLGAKPTAMLSDSGTNTRRSNNFHVDTGVYEAWDVTGSTPMGAIELGHASDTTVARTAPGRATIDGAEVITSTAVAAVDAKTPPVDADLFVTFDSAASNAPKRLTWANIKATLGTWLDTLTATWANKTLTAPVLTGTSIVPQSSLVALHNQADQTTNYERARHYWSSNAYTIETDASGSGTNRDLQMVAANNQSIRVFGATQGPTVGTVRQRANLSAANGCIAGVNGTLSASSGLQYALSVSPTINQTSTGGYTGLLINVTETATGTGAKKPLDVQVGGVSKFSVDNTGVVTAAPSATAGTALVRAAVPATATSTGIAGQVAFDASFAYFCTATNTWVRAALATW